MVPGVWRFWIAAYERLAARLLREFGTPEAVFRAKLRSLEACNLPAPAAPAIFKKQNFWRAGKEVDAIRRIGCRGLNCTEPEHPQTSLQIYEPPALLYVRGDASILNAPALSIEKVLEKHQRTARGISSGPGELPVRNSILAGMPLGGNAMQEMSFASSQLIKQGAKLVTSAEDMIEDLPTPIRAALVQAEAMGPRSETCGRETG
jgi:predicted Rossmann fold nucleotide-binding protein DprA/Smf involved in DNA uptake